MQTLSDSIEIDVQPARLWEWLNGFTEHYREWHPDHVSAEWKRGTPNQVGSVLAVVEVLAGHREKLEFKITQVDPPHSLEYRILGAHSLLVPRGAFEVLTRNGTSTFTATIWCRFGAIAGRLFARRIDSLQSHMREEGENLKRLLEASS